MPTIVFELVKDPMGFPKITVTKDNWHRDKVDIRFDIEIVSGQGSISVSKIQLTEEEAADLSKAISAEIFLQPDEGEK